MSKFFSRWFRKVPPSVPVAPDIALPGPNPIESVPALDEEAVLRAALEQGDRSAVARLVVEGTSTKIRQLAAQALEDPSEIKPLLREVRGRDKNVYKILRQKCDAVLARERTEAQLREELNAASAAIGRHVRRSYDPLFTPTLEQLEVRWRPLATAAPEVMRQQVEHDIERCRETIAAHLKEVAAQAAHELAEANIAAEAKRLSELAKSEAAAAAAIIAAEEAAKSKALAEKLAAEAQAIRQIGGLIFKAHGALKEGSSSRAAGLRRAIEDKLAAVPPLPAHLIRQLQDLDDRLNELKDWKSYAAAPKRSELIERMEKLIDAKLPPRELADEIKRLQAQWKTVSRGVAEESDEDWQRFQTAAQTAYQPCKEYFTEQARQRAENLEKRKTLLDRLAVFESSQNWEQPDWRLLGTVLGEARQEWRDASPVDREAGRAAQETFDAAIARLQGRLDEERERNLRQKKNLVARAKHFLAATDTRKAADEIKQLQLKWKAVGITPREEDRALWEEFRLHCDAAFQRREREHTAHVAELRAKKAEEAAVRAELEEAAREYGAASEDGSKFSQLQSAFESLRDTKS
jgi:hypothetical protein